MLIVPISKKLSKVDYYFFRQYIPLLAGVICPFFDLLFRPTIAGAEIIEGKLAENEMTMTDVSVKAQNNTDKGDRL